MGSAAGDTRGLHWSALPWAVRGSCLSTSLPTVEGGANYTQVGKLQVALFLYRTEPIPAKVPPSSVFLGQPFRHGRTSSLNKTLSACLFFFFLFFLPLRAVWSLGSVLSRALPRCDSAWQKAGLSLPGSHTPKPLTQWLQYSVFPASGLNYANPQILCCSLCTFQPLPSPPQAKV